MWLCPPLMQLTALSHTEQRQVEEFKVRWCYNYFTIVTLLLLHMQFQVPIQAKYLKITIADGYDHFARVHSISANWKFLDSMTQLAENSIFNWV